MVATHLHCPKCAAVQRATVGPLVPGERALGVAVRCMICDHLAFTLLGAARIYCGVCDEVQLAALRSVGNVDAKVLLCGRCLDAKATLYGEPQPSARR